MKKLIALLLTLVLCLSLLTACAQKAKTPEANDAPASETPETPAAPETPAEPDAPAEPETPAQQPEPAPAEPAAPAAPADEELPFQDVEIRVMLVRDNDAGDEAALEAALNEMLAEKLGLQVDLTFFSIGEYSTQLSLALSSGECVDLASMTPIPGSTFDSVTANGQAMVLNDLIANYGPGIQAAAGKYLDAGSVGGKIYSIPVLRQKASILRTAYSTDLVESLGLTEQANAVSDFAALVELGKAIAENSDTLYPFAGMRYLNARASFIFGDGDFASIVPYDTLGDSQQNIYLDTDGKAKLLYENEAYIASLKMFASWVDQGLVWPDTFTNTDYSAIPLVGQGISALGISAGEFGGEQTAAIQAGMPISFIPMCNGTVSTKEFVLWSNFIPVTAEEPEAAMAFLDLLYTDPEAITLLVDGVEGVNFVMNDRGEATTPEGTDVMTCGWHMGDFFIGNSFLLPPWDGAGADFRVRAREDLENSPASEALGFALDTQPLQDYIGALTGVNEEYWFSLMSGMYTDSLYSEYISALEAAGVRSYLDAINGQLDAWRAAQ